MDWNRIEGDWKQLKGTAKQHWGRLTDDDLAAINGRREELEEVGRSATAMPRTASSARSRIG